MKYPKYEIYEKLYEKYFQKGVCYLIEQADIKPCDRVLDLCGGNGRLTQELKKLALDVTYLDQEKDMIPENISEQGIKVVNDSVQNFLENVQEKYDKVFCEQAINYWLLKVEPSKLANLLKENGLFIFNTFSKKPGNKPMIKEYSIDGINFIEISYLAGKEVFHIQVREDMPPHFTTFDWIPKEKFESILSPYFDLKVLDDGKSSLYICRKKL